MSELREDQDICAFVTHTASCHEAQNRIDYLNFIFCVAIDYIDVSFTLAILMLLLIASVLVLALCALALNSISNVLSIVKYFQMNEHNAGVTVMVLFNGIPDIISAFFFYDGDTEMLINEMLGTSLYLRAFHSGILILLFPVTLLATYFKRDAFSFLCGILVLFHMTSERDTNILEGIFAMTFYPILCCVVCYHHHVARKERKGFDHKEVTEEIKIRLELTKEIQIIQLPMMSHANPVTLNILKQFLEVISPFRKEIYNTASLWQKLLIFVAIPVKLLVPVVNLRMPGEGWSRLLLVVNFFLSPLIVLQFIGLQYVLYSLSIGILLAMLVFCFTKTNVPKYQLAIAFYGICCEMLITHFLAAELLSILVTLGNIFGVKRSVIGTTLLAWGNTIPEVVVYQALLSWKIKTMPLVEFLMAPLFNMIFAIGLTTVLRCIDKKSFTVVTRAGDLGQSGLWFSFLHHILFTFAVFTVNFHLRKSIGIYSMFFYLIFVLYTFLYEFDLIHAFGSDHNDEEKFIAASWA
ncbi:mitochondrial sodium/calcium exchanger protein-like [Episyrphus balteatus]|uniref:mitochondrial sodium/calcium exchanger protein-like n=1 Tax=Episyrphus balteatus TaxID=286459 RepID=UPI002486952C|nr:mitochondrial sodium/calcium exchanger protein-like [Episyrphus balteatus]